MGPKPRKSVPVTCGNPLIGFLWRILGRVGRRSWTVSTVPPVCCALKGRSVCLTRLTARSIHIPTLVMCLATRSDMILGMEEIIKLIEESAVYIPPEFGKDPHSLHGYSQGVLGGRAQAIRILRGEPLQP